MSFLGQLHNSSNRFRIRGWRFVIAARAWKIQNKSQPPHERRVNTLFPFGGYNGDAIILLYSLEQIVYFSICIAIVAVFDLAAFSEQRVGVIKEEDRILCLGRRKDLSQVLFRLANILTNNLTQVDVIDIASQFFCQHFCRRSPLFYFSAREQYADPGRSL